MSRSHRGSTRHLGCAPRGPEFTTQASRRCSPSGAAPTLALLRSRRRYLGSVALVQRERTLGRRRGAGDSGPLPRCWRVHWPGASQSLPAASHRGRSLSRSADGGTDRLVAAELYTRRLRRRTGACGVTESRTWPGCSSDARPVALVGAAALHRRARVPRLSARHSRQRPRWAERVPSGSVDTLGGRPPVPGCVRSVTRPVRAVSGQHVGPQSPVRSPLRWCEHERRGRGTHPAGAATTLTVPRSALLTCEQ